MKKIVRYEANDGKSFDLEQDCLRYEKNVEENRAGAYDSFLDTYEGKALLRKHSLTEIGVWEVRGEDPNCDLGGPHSNPYLFTIRGELEKVIKKAVVTCGFWQWGGGGSIKKLEIKEI